MFLNYLEEENKERFLKLSVYAALANGVFAEEEKEMLCAYCREMNIPEMIPDTSDVLENVLADIEENANSVEKNIIVLEILGLMKVDSIYDEEEKEFIKKIVEGIKVEKSFLDKIYSLLEVYTVVYKELFNTIMEG